MEAYADALRVKADSLRSLAAHAYQDDKRTLSADRGESGSTNQDEHASIDYEQETRAVA